VEATLDEAPMVQTALQEDRVVSAEGDELWSQVPARYARFAGITTLVCAPVSAGGHWLGVIFADGGGDSFELSDQEERAMMTLGRLAAVASTVERSTRQQERAHSLDERIALTREVHEQVIQRLFGLSLVLGADRPLEADERERCATELQAVLEQLRLTLGRPLAPQEPHTETTLAQLLEHRARASGLEVEWSPGAEVPPELEPLAQSVVIEALRNAEKHADGSARSVRVGRSERSFELEVVNDGVVDGRRGAGLGLRILTLEALQHNGLLEFGPVGDNGWRVRLLVPVDDA
jgi:signal transduction histidine kinase